MVNRPRIAFIGNCQAQTLTSLSITLGLPVDPIILPPVFEAALFDDSSVRQAIEGCDYVFNQLVSDTFAVDFVRPGEMKTSFGDRAFSWPNIYFDGYFPTISYMYAADGSKITGPLSDYHFKSIFASWAEGREPEDAWAELNEGRASGLSSNPVEDSFTRLIARERQTELGISDYLISRFRYQSLFYSMNHPSNDVIVEMLRRMMAAIDVEMPEPRAISEALKTFGYTLDSIRPVYFDYIRDRYMIRTPLETRALGKTLSQQDSLIKEGNEARYYSGKELVSAYYQVYDSVAGLGIMHSGD